MPQPTREGAQDDPEIELFGGMVRSAIVQGVKGTIGGGSATEHTRAAGRLNARQWFKSAQFLDGVHCSMPMPAPFGTHR